MGIAISESDREPVGPGEESVWDYPRPPRIEKVEKEISIVSKKDPSIIILKTKNAYRILETSHPPTYYMPVDEINKDYVKPSNHRSTFCEWKGVAKYWDVIIPQTKENYHGVGFSYPSPTQRYSEITNHISFYAKDFICKVDDEIVTPQPGNYYSGWITKNIKGPFKGGPGSWGW